MYNQVIEKLKDGERLPEPQYCPSNVYAVVMKRCWTENPNERLNFDEARNNLICVSSDTSIIHVGYLLPPKTLRYERLLFLTETFFRVWTR